MSYETIRDQLQVVISGVSGMGTVHPYQRWSTNWSKFLDHYKDESSGKINGCAITRTGKDKMLRPGSVVEWAQIFTCRFYYGLKDADASEIVFQLLIDDVDDAILQNQTLNGSCETTWPNWGPMKGVDGLKIDIIDTRMFGNVLCHFAEGRVCALEMENF